MIGPFQSEVRLSLHQERILSSLIGFYTDERVDQILVPVTQSRSVTSLRALDWLVTNYSKKHHVLCRTQQGELFNIHQGYKDALELHKRRNFDPFRRRPSRVLVHRPAGQPPVPTTVGQLLFMCWAHENGVVEYTRTHASQIEADMNQTTRASRASKRAGAGSSRGTGGDNGMRSGGGKRKELSRGPGRLCTVYPSARNIEVS